MKSADFKELEETVSTDSGEESVAQQLSSSAESASSDGESHDDPQSDDDSSFLVYSTAILLQLRAAFGNGKGSTSPVTYGTRSYAELRPRAAVTPQKKTKAPAVRSGPPAALAPRTGGDDEKVTRAIRSILNKLTVEKFDSLYEQVATCGVQTPGHITILMGDIFEKATAQHHFIPMYADLCVRLGNDERMTQAAESEGQSNSFRRLLLGQCQMAFEQLLQPSSGKDDEEMNALRKKRALGNVKLVGQIMNRGMLSSKLLCGCAEALLAEHEACAEALESLAAFLTVVGSRFDVASWQHHGKLEAVFSRVSELIVDKKIPSRTRFLLRDVLDLRKAGWPGQMRPTMQGAGPMKLDEVHQQGSEERAAHSFPKSEKARNWKDARVNDRSEKPKREKATNQRASVKDPLEQATPPVSTASYDPAAFHRALVGAMRDLRADRDVDAAIRKVCAGAVPVQYQAKEFADVLTRALEETRGPVRRSALALAAGLASEPGAFQQAECAVGAGGFFKEIYEQLCTEVPHLDAIAAAELVPMLRSVLPAADLQTCLPEDLQV